MAAVQDTAPKVTRHELQGCNCPSPLQVLHQARQDSPVQRALEAHSGSPLIGLEYLVEVREQGAGQPASLCLLCSKEIPLANIVNHASYPTHRLQYLECFYPIGSLPRCSSSLPGTSCSCF